MILLNQVRCSKCGDEPYSTYRHDFRYCVCGAIAVDGGMDYLKRVGDVLGCTELSIEMDNKLVEACKKTIYESYSVSRKPLGVLCDFVRTLRDNGYEVKKSEKFSKNSDSPVNSDRKHSDCSCRSCEIIAFRERG